MTTHVKYVMTGVINTPPYQRVTWTVWDTPDTDGSESGFSNLIDIAVDYQVIDEVTSGGNNGVGPQPVIPEPPVPLVVKIQYIMKATTVASPYTLITWKVSDAPDFTGVYSGYGVGQLENICVDYTEIDDVNRGPQAVPQINELVGPAGGDLSGTYPNPTVVGIGGDPIDFTGLGSDYIIVFNGTQWEVQPIPSGLFSANGDLTGTNLNQTVVGLRTKSLDSSLASIGATEDGYLLTWENSSSSWKAKINASAILLGDVTGLTGNNTISKLQGITVSATSPTTDQVLTFNGSAWVPSTGVNGPAGGDLSGFYPNPTVAKINGFAVPPSGTFSVGNVLQVTGTHQLNYQPVNLAGGANFVTGILPAGNQAAQGLAGDLSGTTSAATVIKLQNNSVASDAPANGEVLTWISANNQWEPYPITAGSVTLAGDVTGIATANTVERLTGLLGVVTIGAEHLIWDNTLSHPKLMQAPVIGTSTSIVEVSGQNSQDGYGGYTYITAGIGKTNLGAGQLVGGNLLLGPYYADFYPTPQLGFQLLVGGPLNYGLRMYTDGVLNVGSYGLGVAHFDSNGNVTSSAVNLAGGSSEVTGVLPIANQAAQTMGGDVSGTTAAAQVNIARGLKSATTTVSVSGATAPSSGQVLTATNSTTATWQNPASTSPTGSAGGDLTGSTYPNPFISAISGSGGAGGSITVLADTFAFTSGSKFLAHADAGESITISTQSVGSSSTGGAINLNAGAGSGTSSVGGSVYINAGDCTGAAPTGGEVVIRGGDLTGSTAGGSAGPISIITGDASVGSGVYGGFLTLATPDHANSGGSGDVIIKTGDITGGNSGVSGDMLIKTGAGAGTNSSSGSLTLQVGTKTGGGTAASLFLQTNGANTRVSIDSSGTINVPGFAGGGSGVVTVDNSGNLAFGTSGPPGGAAGGDLGGTYPNPTVVAVTGAAGLLPIASTAAGLRWAAGATTPSLAQADTGSGNGQNLSIIAQSSSAGSSTGGNLLLISGDGSSADGAIAFYTGVSNLRGQIGGTGVWRISNLSTGIVHADSNGDLTSSAVNLASGDVTGTLPTGNQAAQTMGGDVSGTTNAATVEKIKATTITTAGGALSPGAVLRVTGVATADWGQLDLADTDAVTGVLPKANQAAQDMAGDVSGTTAASVVDKIKSKTLDSSIGTAGAGQDQYVITWDNGTTSYKLLAASGGVTWANDLAGSSGTNQWVAEISGSGGGGGTVPLNITTLEFAADQINPLIYQADETVNDASYMKIQAQNATASGKFGGNLFLQSGNGPTNAEDGTLIFQTGVTTRMSIANDGAVSIQNLSTGIVHADSGGTLTSSTVDADEITAGTAGQLLLNNSTPVPTWTTMSGDTTISSAGATTLVAIRGKATATSLASVGATQDGYVLTWVNGSSEWQAKPGTGSGGGITTVGTIDTSPNSNGLFISGSTISTQLASASQPGMVSTGTQTMAGAKTFSGALTAGSTTTKNTMVGGQIWTTRSLAGDLTIDTTTTDMIILCSTAAARSITLPAPVNGRIFIIKDSTGQAETNNITLIRNGSEKIEGVAASRTLSTNWGVWTVTTDGTDWFFL